MKSKSKSVSKASSKEIFGWCAFDFANSSYTTVIITVIFGPVFANLIVPSSSDSNNPHALGNSLWALALGISYILTALLGPLLGTITDLSPTKKKFLFSAYLSCVCSTALLYFVNSPQLYWLAFIIIILSCASFSLSENFISSFLPFLAEKKELGKISGYAWAVGYFGGILSVIFVRLLVGESTPENFDRLRWIGPLTALFFLLAGIPTFLFLKEPKLTVSKEKGSSYFYLALGRLKKSLREIRRFRDLSLFLSALFFALAALSIAVSFTFIYGKQELGLNHKEEALAFVFTNLSAALGAFVFGRLQDRWGALRIFMLTLFLWIVSILFLFYIRELKDLLAFSLNINYSLQSIFIAFASFAGLGLGATQAGGRTIVALFSPENRAGEFFGLWGIAGKLAMAFGLFSIAGLQSLFGLHNSLLIMVFFFAFSLGLCFFAREKRGIRRADQEAYMTNPPANPLA